MYISTYVPNLRDCIFYKITDINKTSQNKIKESSLVHPAMNLLRYMHVAGR
jgi:hypothetical protein